MRRFAWMVWVASGLTCAGCATPGTPITDAGFGESVRQARALQIIERRAISERPGLHGLDGQAARAAIERYQESFRTPGRSFEAGGIGGVLGVGSER